MEKTLKDIKQEEAFEAWKLANRKGSCFCVTGFGKNKLALWAAEELPATAKILFLAEAIDREKDFKDEQIKWEYKGASIEFLCYQSAYKLEDQFYDLVIADEIDSSLTPIYSSFYFKNKFDRILGLTATIDKSSKVSEDSEVTKLELLNKFAPVCYKYTISQGQLDKTSRELEICIISHRLDGVNKNVKAGSKLKPFLTTEQAGYEYWDKQFKQALFLPDGDVKDFRIRITSAARAKLLYNLPSKVIEVKKLLTGIGEEDRTLVFGNSLDALNQVVKHVISSKNSDKKNEKIREDFEKDKIKVIGSFKKLERGANLSELDNCVLMSYYSKERIAVQRLGRLRQNDNKIGKVYIFVTEFTQEVKWLSKMLEDFTGFTVNRFISVEQCLEHLNKTKAKDYVKETSK